MVREILGILKIVIFTDKKVFEEYLKKKRSREIDLFTIKGN